MFFVWLADVLNDLMNLTDDVTFFYGISLWNLIIFFVVVYDIEQIIRAIFQSSQADTSTAGKGDAK